MVYVWPRKIQKHRFYGKYPKIKICWNSTFLKTYLNCNLAKVLRISISWSWHISFSRKVNLKPTHSTVVNVLFIQIIDTMLHTAFVLFVEKIANSLCTTNSQYTNYNLIVFSNFATVPVVQPLPVSLALFQGPLWRYFCLLKSEKSFSVVNIQTIKVRKKKKFDHQIFWNKPFKVETAELDV